MYIRGLSGILLIALIAAQARAAAPTVVYPTGVFPDDVAHVQAALDLGGTVILNRWLPATVPFRF